MDNNLKFLLSLTILIVIQSTRMETLSMNDSPTRTHEIFPPMEKSKYIQIYQLENILFSIEETFKKLNDKQKEDAISVTQATDELKLINGKLQNIENQINQLEQVESFNKHRFELIQENHVKDGLQFDELKRKVERSQQLMNNRINEIDTSLENLRNNQGIILNEIRKIIELQTQMTTGVEELKKNSKPDRINDRPNLRTNQRRLPEDVDINDSFQTIQEQIRSVQSMMSEYINVAREINDDLQTHKFDIANAIKSMEGNIINEIRIKSYEDIYTLNTTFTTNFLTLLNEQETFKNNCHAIHLHEEQLADKAIYIIEKLGQKTNNRTGCIPSVPDLTLKTKSKESNIDQVTELIPKKTGLSSSKNLIEEELIER